VNPDPWYFTHDVYEQSRYDTTIAAMEGRRYERAFEPGCSVGELTRRLAKQCRHVDAIDISATAIDRAKRRCREFPNVDLIVGKVPHQTPDGVFDLVVFSEIGYYFEQASLQVLGDMLVRRIQVSGTLLAVHWLGRSKDHI